MFLFCPFYCFVFLLFFCLFVFLMYFLYISFCIFCFVLFFLYMLYNYVEQGAASKVNAGILEIFQNSNKPINNIDEQKHAQN